MAGVCQVQAQHLHWPLEWDDEILWAQGFRPPLTAPDADGDGISDEDEEILLLDPLSPEDGLADWDEDGYDEAWEWYIASDPDDPFDPDDLGLSAPTALQSAASAPPADTPLTITNGVFDAAWDTKAKPPYNRRRHREYPGTDNGFYYQLLESVAGWTALNGSRIEIWTLSGEHVVELEGDDGNYGIKQIIDNPTAGLHQLNWQHSERLNYPGDGNDYTVKAVLEEGGSDIFLLSEQTYTGNPGGFASASFKFYIPQNLLTTGVKLRIEFAPVSNDKTGALIKNVSAANGTLVTKFVTPAGDPTIAPGPEGSNNGDDGAGTDKSEGQNEFTFSDAAEGVLTIKLIASIEGFKDFHANLKEALLQDIEFSAGDIDGSQQAWTTAGADPGKAIAVPDKDQITATTTFTGLPELNTSFGDKNATFSFRGSELGTEDYEVFFPKNAANHPDPGKGETPNWYFYWLQVYQQKFGNVENVHYSPLVTNYWGVAYITFAYGGPAPLDSVEIYDGASLEGSSYNVGKFFTGIDQFMSVVVHEHRHIWQGTTFDNYIPENLRFVSGTPWEFGWSINFDWANHNHWTLGDDDKPGVPGVDDDGDGNVDNVRSDSIGEVGKGDRPENDDHFLVHPDASDPDWPAGLEIPTPNDGPEEIESDALNYADNMMNDHDQFDEDWSSPGKQHQTAKDYND